MTVPEAKLGPLDRADGSATYSHSGYSVICAVNGPVEVQRRDEIPDEAAIEVNVRPMIGVGGPKERHIETLIHATLRHIILTHLHPRTLIQITLQILSVPGTESDLRPSSHVHLLPSLLNAASLGLLHASIPLSTTLTSAMVSLPSSTTDNAILDPSPAQIKAANSTHVFAFSAKGEALLVESEGSFSIEEWQRAEEVARGACLGLVSEGEEGEEDVEMDDGEEGGVGLPGIFGGRKGQNPSVMDVLREAVEERVKEAGKWRSS
ncbi:Exosome complex component RRP46-like protein [Elsinoe fawcettii]|nr:Exosome complex component RRP46-like protein [Elsinoe fawcettii]